MKLTIACCCLGLFTSSNAIADTTVAMSLVDANGVSTPVGEVTISESKYGLVFTPALHGLPPGLHGFHLHQNASCAPGAKDGKPAPAMAAGDHYDPKKSGHHGLIATIKDQGCQ